jgi:ribosome-binding protein aMBF1 (putative translation factor)
MLAMFLNIGNKKVMPEAKTEILAEISEHAEVALREAAAAAGVSVEELAGRIIEQAIHDAKRGRHAAH